MPLTLTFTKGVLPDGAQFEAIDRITRSFLAAHNLTGNAVMTPNVTAHVHIMPKGSTFAGGKPVEGAWIETKTPSFALADRAVQAKFFSEATRILHELSEGRLSTDRIWSNGVHAVDGTWNLGGTPMTNAQIGEAVSAG